MNHRSPCRLLAALYAGLCLLESNLSGAEPAKPREKFELTGEVRLQLPRKPRRLVAYVALQGNTIPYFSYTWTSFDGKFKFKRLPPGSYSLYVEVRRRGEKRLTVEVSPSFADSKGRVRQEVMVEPGQSLATRQRPDVVSVRELSIPEKARNHYLNAEKKLSKGEVKKGIELLERAVNLAPHFVAAINRIGTIYHIQKEFAKAEQYFREALGKDPNSFAPLVNLGGTLIALGKFQEAVEINQRAVAAKPLDALANAQLGLSYVSVKEDDKAVGYLVRTKELDPQHFTFPQLTLADIYQRQKKLQLVLQELREFLRFHPDDAHAALIRKQIEGIDK